MLPCIISCCGFLYQYIVHEHVLKYHKFCHGISIANNTARLQYIFGDEDGILLLTVMAALLGKVDAFDPQHEDWPQYVERLDQFFKANGLMGNAKATKQHATFLIVIGPGPYKLLHSLISPAKPTDKAYDELVKKLTDHYSPTPSEVMQRF